MTVQSFRDAAMARDLLALRLLIVAFFLSGTGALIYQVIWQRMLGLFAGADSTSAALVVGAFLLGLGIGLERERASREREREERYTERQINR